MNVLYCDSYWRSPDNIFSVNFVTEDRVYCLIGRQVSTAVEISVLHSNIILLTKYCLGQTFLICWITLPADLKNWDFKKRGIWRSSGDERNL